MGGTERAERPADPTTVPDPADPGGGAPPGADPEGAAGTDVPADGDLDAAPTGEGADPTWDAGWAPEADLDRLRAERDEHLDRLLRLQADFDNFRKRTARDQAAAADRKVEALVVHLLPVLDSLDLALVSSDAGGEEGESLRKGFELVYSGLLGVLEQAGLARIDAAEVPFDPELHEAVLQSDEGRSEPTVVEVLRTGYRFKQRVVRPAMVRVVK